MAELADTHSMKRRRRPAKSCEPCRARKVRCDQKSPCGPCQKARATPTCIYAADTVRLPSPRPSPEIVAGGTVTAPPISTMAHLESSPWATVSDMAQLQQQVNQLQTQIDSLKPKEASQSNKKGATPTASTRVAPATPKLRQTATKNKVYGANHWIHTLKLLKTGTVGMKDVEVSFDILPKDGFAKEQQAVSTKRGIIKQAEMPVLQEPVPDLLSTIPNRTRCDELVDTYMATYEKMYRILHVPSFYKEYEAFWQNPLASRVAFRMELVLVLALGAGLSDQDGELAVMERQGRTWIYAAQWWLNGPIERSTFTLEGIQIACLFQLARQMTGLGRGWVSSGSLLQMAFSVGLHRDPDRFPSVAPFQAEMQRRLWATVRELSLLAAMDSPMHVSIDGDCCDTKPPANLNDKDMVPGAASDAVFTPKPDGKLTDSSLQRLLLQSRPVRLRAVQQLHSVKELVYADTHQLCTKITDAQKRLFQFFKTHLSSTLVTRFHHVFLDIHFRLHMLRLHRQFLLQRPDDTECSISQTFCFRNAMAIASYVSILPPGPDRPSTSTSTPVSPSDTHHRRLANLFANATGATKAPLSLEITTMLGLEIRMQLAEEPPAVHTLPITPNPFYDEWPIVSRVPYFVRWQSSALGRPISPLSFGEPCRSALPERYQEPDPQQPPLPSPRNHSKPDREQIFATLQKIVDALLQRIEQGSPRVKAYGLTMLMITQLRELEKGEKPAKEAQKMMPPWLGSVKGHMENAVERLSASSVGLNVNGSGDVVMGADFDIDELLAMDFTGTGAGGDMFDFQLWNTLAVGETK